MRCSLSLRNRIRTGARRRGDAVLLAPASSLTLLATCLRLFPIQLLRRLGRTGVWLRPSPPSRTRNTGAKLFRQHLEHYAPPDPLYEYYKGKQRRKEASTAFPPRLWLLVSFFPHPA